jgi:hypothetical protein
LLLVSFALLLRLLRRDYALLLVCAVRCLLLKGCVTPASLLLPPQQQMCLALATQLLT